MLNTKINRIYNFSYEEDSYPNELKKLVLLIFDTFHISSQDYKSHFKTKGDKVNLLSWRNRKLTIRISPIKECASYLLSISFIPEAINKNELLSILNKFSKYFINLDKILDKYSSNLNYHNTILLYDSSFSGAEIPNERLIAIFKQILTGGDENLILLLCTSVIMENPLYYDVLKEPLQEALAKKNSPILNDTYKDVLAFIEDYSEL
jgi:hypothetical protein